jgi:hypothetical protein
VSTDAEVLDDTFVQLLASHSPVVVVLRRRFIQTFGASGAEISCVRHRPSIQQKTTMIVGDQSY